MGWQQSTSGTWYPGCNCLNCVCCGNSPVTHTVSGCSTTVQDFAWALTQVKAGSKVRRHAWAINVYVHRIHGSKRLMIDYLNTGGEYTPHPEDMIATDWEIYETKCGECGRPTS